MEAILPCLLIMSKEAYPCSLIQRSAIYERQKAHISTLVSSNMHQDGKVTIDCVCTYMFVIHDVNARLFFILTV